MQQGDRNFERSNSAINLSQAKAAIASAVGLMLIVLTFIVWRIEQYDSFQTGCELIGLVAVIAVLLAYFANNLTRITFRSFPTLFDREDKRIDYFLALIFPSIILISLGLLFISLTPAWKWWGYFIGALVVPNSMFISLDTMLGVKRKRVRYFIGIICLFATGIGLGLSVSFKGI